MREQKLTDAEQALREYKSRIAGMAVEEMDLSKIACELGALADARVREVVAGAFMRADTEAPEVEIDGERWDNRQVTRGEYHTTFGVVVVEQRTYQRAGRGRVAIPLDLRLGIMEGRYTPKEAITARLPPPRERSPDKPSWMPFTWPRSCRKGRMPSRARQRARRRSSPPRSVRPFCSSAKPFCRTASRHCTKSSGAPTRNEKRETRNEKRVKRAA
jgi:hypothetical protein